MRMRRPDAALLPGLLLIALAAHSAAANAQKKPKDTLPGYDRAARAALVHPAIVYVSPDDDAQHIAEVLPGHEVVVIERSGAWVRVFANTDAPDEQADDQKPEFSTDDTVTPASGWIHDKGIVTPATANGDAILYGSAASFEEQAGSRTHPRTPPRRRTCSTGGWPTTSPTRLWRRRRCSARRTCAGSRQGRHQHAALGPRAGGLPASAALRGRVCRR